MTPKFWTYKEWQIEKDVSGDFWIGPNGSRKSLLKNTRTLKDAKAVVTHRIAKQNEFQAILSSHSISTVNDIDQLKKNGESRHSVMVRLFGEKLTLQLLHVLSINQCNKAI